MSSSSAQPNNGFHYLLRGFKMLREPGVRRYAWGPIIINVIIMIGLTLFSVDQFTSWVDQALTKIPSWLGFLEWVLWPIFVIVTLTIVIFTFTILVNLVGAPFNALLAEHVQEQLSGEAPPSSSENWQQFLAAVPRSLTRELARLLFTVPIALLIWLITFIPALNTVSPLLWFLWGAWMMSIQYTDYAADNNRLSFKQFRITLAKDRLLTLGFGACVAIATLIPLLNLFVMPAAVCGGCIMWCERLTAHS